MPLPKLPVQTYETTLPSNEKLIQFQPYRTYHEKALLIAQQSQDTRTIVETYQNVIKDCIVGEYDPFKAPAFDNTWLFLQIRSKSVGETVTTGVKCPDCGHGFQLKIDLGALEVDRNENHKKEIKVMDNLVIGMRYPSFEVLGNKAFDGYRESDFIEIIAACIDTVQTEEGLATRKSGDFTDADAIEFVGSMTAKQLGSLREFFETMPTIKMQLPIRCPKCKAENTLTLDGASDFFG